MDQQKELTEMFEEEKEHVGRAIRRFRASRFKGTIKFAYLMYQNFYHDWRDASPAFMDKVECDEYGVSFKQFQQMCSVLQLSMRQVLEVAVLLKAKEAQKAKLQQQVVGVGHPH